MYRDKRFRQIWLSGLLFQLGRWWDFTVLAWIVITLDGSVFEVALLGFFRQVPLAVLGPISGALSDLVPKFWLLTIAAFISALVGGALTAVTLLEVVNLTQIYAVSTILGVAMALEIPAKRALIQEALSDGEFVSGLSLDQVAQNVTRMGAPVAAGIAIATIGSGPAYAFSVVAFFGAGIAALQLRHLAGAVGDVDDAFVRSLRSLGGSVRSFVGSLGSGVKHAKENEIIRGVLIVTIVWNVLIFPHQWLFAVFAEDVLGVGPERYGLMGTAQGIGAFVAAVAFVMARSTPYPALWFGLGAIAFSGGVLMFGLSPWYELTLVGLLFAGVGQGTYFIFQTATILSAADPAMRGRAMGMLTLCIGTAPLGVVLVGALADVVGPRLAVAGPATLAIVVLGVVALASPRLFRYRQGAAVAGSGRPSAGAHDA